MVGNELDNAGDPMAVHDSINILLNELSAAKEHITELNTQVQRLYNENQQLRLHIESLDSNKQAAAAPCSFTPVGNDNPPRKIAKVSNVEHQSPSDGASGSTSSNVHNDGFTTVSSRKNRKKILQTLDANLNTVRGAIKTAKCTGFLLKQSSVNAPIKITVEKSDEIPAIRQALIKHSISFHEYKWDEEKLQALVIRGLVGVTTEDLPSIFDELVNAGIPSDAKLSLLVTGHMKANPNVPHNTLLKLVLPANFDTSLLRKIKFVDHVAISFEKLKSKHIIQCKNCQRFGHSAGGCQHPHRCVKCGANHLKDACPRTSNKAVKLVCCNCNGEHSANNLRECPYFIKNFGQNRVVINNVSKPPAGLSGGKNIRVPGSLDSPAVGTRFLSKSYAAVAGSTSAANGGTAVSSSYTPHHVNLGGVVSKLDLIMQMVSRHDALLQKLCANG